MPGLVTAGKNAMLDSATTWPPAFTSLHSAYPGGSGTNELTGGSPAYARQAASWASAASGSKALSADQTFNVPAGSTVAWVGYWTTVTGGTYLGCGPAKGDLGSTAAAPKTFVMEDESTDVFDCIAHGFSDGQTVVVWSVAGTIPTGVTEGTTYYVINSTTNTFQLSATSGGASVSLSAKGSGQVERIVAEVYASQGTATVSTATTVSL